MIDALVSEKWKEWKNNIYLQKYVSVVKDHLHGEKNGKETGIMLNIVVKNAEVKNSNNLVYHQLKSTK